MGLFKSRNERRLEREVEIRKGMNLIKKNIRDLSRHETDYLTKAKRAKQLGSTDQLVFLKKTIKRCASQRMLMERQLLSIETASQIKNQAEAHAQFARAMTAVSRSISEMFGTTDLMKTQAEFEKAMEKAETMEERMELFLEMSSESMTGEPVSAGDVVTDEEIERRIDAEIAREESGEIDKEIEAGLDEIQKELGRE